jgi:hypothetical protein
MFVEVSNDKKPGSTRIYDKKNNVQGYWIPPKLPQWALPDNEKGNGTKGTQQTPSQSRDEHSRDKRNKSENNNAKQQKDQSSAKTQSKGFDRNAATKAIREFLENTGLKESPQYIIPLFKRINPGIKQTNIKDVFEQANEEELRKYYFTLKPVSDLVNVTNFYKISLEDALNYVQILLPKVKVESLFSCFMNLTHDHVKEIAEFIKDDLKNGNIQKIA